MVVLLEEAVAVLKKTHPRQQLLVLEDTPALRQSWAAFDCGWRQEAEAVTHNCTGRSLPRLKELSPLTLTLTELQESEPVPPAAAVERPEQYPQAGSCFRAAVGSESEEALHVVPQRQGREAASWAEPLERAAEVWFPPGPTLCHAPSKHLCAELTTQYRCRSRLRIL